MKSRNKAIKLAAMILFIIITLSVLMILVFSLATENTVFDLRRKCSSVQCESEESIAIIDDYSLYLGDKVVSIEALKNYAILDYVQAYQNGLLILAESDSPIHTNDNCKCHISLQLIDFEGEVVKSADLGCFDSYYRTQGAIGFIEDIDAYISCRIIDGDIFISDTTHTVKIETELWNTVNDATDIPNTDFSLQHQSSVITVTNGTTSLTKDISSETISEHTKVGNKILKNCRDNELFADKAFIVEDRVYFFILPRDLFGNYYPTVFEYNLTTDELLYVSMLAPNSHKSLDAIAVVSYVDEEYCV